MSTYAIGDIQGCYDEFRSLLKICGFNPASDRLWLTGDLINRGPRNLETLKYIIDLGDCVTSILGNHDLHFLAVACGGNRAMKHDTFHDLLEDSHRQDYIEWLRQCPLIHYDADQGYLMVHAGLPPIWNIKTCLERANEVEEILSGEMYKDFLAVMYGDEPAIWDDNLQGMDRIRIITNYFTRLRYCTREGKIELNHKTRKAPQGYRPWFEFDRERMPQIIFGHWAALEGHTGLSHIHALDTGCVWGRTLSALRIDDGQLFSCPAGTSNW